MEVKKIKTAIVDDHTLFRKGMISLLAEEEAIEIVFEARNGAEMMQLMNAGAVPEVILMDINMPQMDGYAATRWVTRTFPGVRVLALSMYGEDKPIIDMLKSGAGGYLLKESRTADLVQAICEIAAHGYYMNSLVSGKLIRSLQENTPQKTDADLLSANEKRFLQLCCSELTYKEIAAQMNLSPHTIDNYREAIFQRFDIKSRTGLVMFAIKNGLIAL